MYSYDTYTNKVITRKKNYTESENKEFFDISKIKITSDMALKIGLEYYKDNEEYAFNNEKDENINIILQKSKGELIWKMIYYKEIINEITGKKDTTGVYLKIDTVTGEIIGIQRGSKVIL